MTNVLAFPSQVVELTTHTPVSVQPSGNRRADFQTELSIAATRFELAVGVGAMLGGLVGAGIGAVTGCVVGAAPGGAIGAIVGGATLGIPVGLYSLVQMNNELAAIA